jgi:SAM-dependent methyltransferase
MGVIGGKLGYKLLRLISPGKSKGYCDGSAYFGRSKMEVLLGASIWSELAGKVVIDFGCGSGSEAVEIAQHGAKRVIGIDIRENALAEGRRAAKDAGVSDICIFATATHEKADVVLSLDAFEHFDNPAEILCVMRKLVKDDGYAIIEFGPTWYHPLGGHLFSVFPWAHLVFTEAALIRWRSDFKTDGASRFREVEGGLNQMTIGYFEHLVARSDFEFVSFETQPIRGLDRFANRLTREFFSSIVRCRLVPRLRTVQN